MKGNSAFFASVFCLSCSFGFSQQEVVIAGKVRSGGIGVEGVRVMNLVSEKVTVSNKMGHFSIPAKEDELLIFSHDAFEYKRRSIDSEDIKNKSIEVDLIRKSTELNEVVVNRNVSTEKLGVQGMKEYSTAERRERAAGGIDKRMHEDYLNYGTLPLDAFINHISGRTRRMRVYVAAERQHALFERISDAYENSYFVRKLKIKPEYVEGFKYYLSQDHDFGLVFDSGDQKTIEREMGVHAMNFNDYFTAEKK